MMTFVPLTAAEKEEIKAKIGPLPIVGAAWPTWVKGTAVLMVVFIFIQMALTVSKVGTEALSNIGGLSILIVFIALGFMAYFMVRSTTTIDEKGLRQSWITKREVSWDEITFAKFIPMLASKRLVIFVKKGRPIIFQGGTRDLQVAFAHISLQFKNRQL